MEIEELAKRKAELNLQLRAISMSNVAGSDVKYMTDLNLAKIKAQKELYEIESKIDAYIKAA